MSFVRWIIEGHEGRIWVESEVGVGSTFSFSLPVRDRVHADEATHPSILDLPPLCILLVEDGGVNQRRVTRLLEKVGHTVIAAGNGNQALEKMAEEELDVVLMDIEMPIMDGMTAIRNLRKREAGRPGRLPVIALTAHTEASDRQRILGAGAYGYLVKPVGIEALLSMIAQILHPG
jgi:two-component system, sensor histidine kinase